MNEQNAVSDVASLWGLPLQAARCPRCGVVHLVPPDREPVTCPACFSAPLEAQPTLLRPEPPELVAEFAVGPAQVGEALKGWLSGMWLRPPDLEPRLLVSRLAKTYIPMWLVDGAVAGAWSAQMGYDYQVASSQEFYRGGQWMTRSLTETRIRWEPRLGQIDRTYQNANAPALENHDRLTTGLGPFKLDSAHAYSPQPVAGAAVRVPDLLPEAAWPAAQDGFDRLVAADCQAAAGAQHVDGYAVQADYRDRNWTQLLLPVYATAYRDDEGQIIPVLVNGQTGRVFGRRRASQKRGWWWSGGLAVAAALCFLLAVLFSAAALVLPLVALVGIVLFALSLVLGVAAPVPAVWAWQFNQRGN